MLQPVRGRENSSPALMIPLAPAFLPATGGRGKRCGRHLSPLSMPLYRRCASWAMCSCSSKYWSWLGRGQISCSHNLRASSPKMHRQRFEPVLQRPWISTRPSVAAQARTSPWSLLASTAAHISLSLTIFIFTSASLRCTYILLLFFPFFTTYLLLLAVSRASECLGSSQESTQKWSQECYVPSI